MFENPQLSDVRRLACDAANVGAWYWDEGGEPVWDLVCHRLFGLNESVPLAFAAFLDSAHPADRATLESAVKHSKTTGTDLSAQFRFMGPNDTLRYLHMVGYPSPEGATGSRLIGILTDITDRRNAETVLLRVTDDLQQFAYGVSHDLQEPLRAVLAYSELITRRHQAQLDPVVALYFSFVRDGARRLERLLVALRDYWRAGSEKQQSVAVDCNVLVAQALENLETILDESGAAVKANLLPVVEGFPGPLAQLFQNLIGNALKYRHPQRVPAVAVSAKKEGAEWVFCVEDNGIGIAAVNLEKVFQMFNRVNETRQDSTGLGLALCKKIVERHGGRIWAESVLSEGSTFYFTLPENR